MPSLLYAYIIIEKFTVTIGPTTTVIFFFFILEGTYACFVCLPSLTFEKKKNF